MTTPLHEDALDQLFNSARTHFAWQARAVSDEQLMHIYELMKMAPTSANCSPTRIVFVKSPTAKEKLRPCLIKENVEKTMQAPVTAIIAYDRIFHEQLPTLFPHTDAKSWFVGNPELIESTAFRNSSLQGAYFILAARALGLDCGPMSGFDAAEIDTAFFPDSQFHANFLVNVGYGDASKLYPRAPRLSFPQACRIE